MSSNAPVNPATAVEQLPKERTTVGDAPPHRHLDRWLIAGIPVTIAVLSFLLSFYTWYENSRPPEIELALPDRVRVTQGEDRAWLYIQPRYVSTSQNDRIDVITRIEIEVKREGESPSIPFDWDEQGTWTFDHETRSLTWNWVADPGPLVVSSAAPQMPTGLFMAPDDWLWVAGDYELTISSPTSVGDQRLVETGTITITEDQHRQLESGRGSLFLTVPLVTDE
ncbi:MAG: hypothetical protein AB7V46_00435 [Thermomicrobiales bacterium]